MFDISGGLQVVLAVMQIAGKVKKGWSYLWEKIGLKPIKLS